MQAAHCACRARFEHVRTDSVRLMHGIASIDDQTVPLTTFDAALEVLTRFQALRNELGNITRWWDDMMQKDTAAHRFDSHDQMEIRRGRGGEGGGPSFLRVFVANL